MKQSKIFLIAALVVFACVIISGCVDSDNTTDREKESGSHDPSDKTDEEIIAMAAKISENFLKEKYTSHASTVACFTLGAQINECDSLCWCEGGEHFYYVIGKCSINDFQSHYYHATIGYNPDIKKWEVGKLSISPTSVSTISWNEIVYNEETMINIGAKYSDYCWDNH